MSLLLLFGSSASSSGDAAPSVEGSGVARAAKLLQYVSIVAPVLVAATVTATAASAGVGSAQATGQQIAGAPIESWLPDYPSQIDRKKPLYKDNTYFVEPIVVTSTGSATGASSGVGAASAVGQQVLVAPLESWLPDYPSYLYRAGNRSQAPTVAEPFSVSSTNGGAGSSSGVGTATGVGSQDTTTPRTVVVSEVPYSAKQLQYSSLTAPVLVSSTTTNAGDGSSSGVGTASGVGSGFPALVDPYFPDSLPRRPFPRAVYVQSPKLNVVVTEGVGASSGLGAATGVGARVIGAVAASSGLGTATGVSNSLPPFVDANVPDVLPRRPFSEATYASSGARPVISINAGVGNATGTGVATGVSNAAAGPAAPASDSGIVRAAKYLQYSAVVAPVYIAPSTQGAGSSTGIGAASGVGESVLPYFRPSFPNYIVRRPYPLAVYTPGHQEFGVITEVPVQSWLPEYNELVPRRKSGHPAQSVTVKPVSTQTNTQGVGTSAGVGTAQAVGLQIVAFSEPQFPDSLVLRKPRHATTSVIVGPVLVPATGAATSAGAGSAQAVGYAVLPFWQPEFVDNPVLRKPRHATTSVIVSPVLVTTVVSGTGTASGASTCSCVGASIRAGIGVCAGASTCLGRGACIGQGVGNAQGQCFCVGSNSIGGRGRMLLTGVG